MLIVFDNDLLNGNPVNPTEVALTLVTADPNGYITLNSDGTVDVAPGTPAESYTLTYQICEIINPTNCDQAIVTITVNAPQIVANDDNANVNGYTGGTAVLTVFDNDLLNGNPVNATEVALTLVTADPNGYITLNPDGTVDVAPGTPAESYTLTYQICEIINPTNCDQAIVTITVNAPQIVANDDNANANGYSGETAVLIVFDNDLLNGNPVNATEVALTLVTADPNGYITLNPDGTVDVAPGTPAGNYTLTYQICEILNPTNCDQAIVTITVNAPQIVANDDYANNVNGHAGETAVVVVFDNDLLNGNPVNPTEVTLTETIPEGNGYLVLNPDGTVDVVPGTPEGTYYLTYQICEILNPANCDDAQVFVTVTHATINAVDDNFTSSAVDCEIGGIAGNILDNDLLNGIALDPNDVNINLINDGGIVGIIISANGDITIPAGLAVGTYNLSYEICEIINPTNCDQANIVISVQDNQNPVITCPADISVNTDPTSCEATSVTITPPVVSDNCGVNTVNGIRSDLLSLADAYPVGTTTITWTVTDFGGNIATCEQLVVVTDIELPSIVCPPTVNVNTDAGLCTASGVVLGTPTVDDNCSVADITNDAPAVFPIGTTTVTWTVTDGSGNIATCEQLVVVTDIELPTIVCPPTVNVNTDAGLCTASGVVLGTPTVDDNCSVADITNDAPAVFPIGTTIVTWTVTDASGNFETCTQNVVVTDIELPSIVCPPTVNVNTDAGLCTASGVVLGTPTVDDNCSVADITNDAPAVFPIGTTIVTWTVTDASGNFETCTQNVVVTDIELPSIVCPPTVNVNTDAGLCTASGVVLGTPTVDDNCSVADITNDAPALFPIGTTTVTWTVTDGSGNIATCEQLVVVTDIELPTIVCPEDIVSCSNIITLTSPTVSDNCGIAIVTNDAPAVFPIGTTTQVTWTVTDVNGNISECTQNVSISDIQLSITASSQVSCHDASDASITINVEGTSGEVVYQLNGGATQSSNVFEGLTAGTYVVVAIDENDCSTTSTEIIIINPDPITVSVEISEQVSCNDESDGTITASATGGTGDYQFSINGIDYQSTNLFEGLPSGSYTVYVKDENGCIAMSDVYHIANPEQLDANIDITAEISCHNETDAEITINAWGGTPPYLYSLDGQTAQTSNVFTNLSVGIYSVKIEDAKGCFIIQEINVKQPNALVLTYEAFCQGGIVGIRLNGSGGSLPYEYSIDGGSTFQASNQFDNTVTGEVIYLVVKDANNCMSEILSVNVANINTLNAEVNIISQNLCHGSNDAAAEIIVTGGTTPYEYNLNNQGYTMNNLFQNLAPGSYSVQIRDLNTCPAFVAFEIEEQSPILIQLLSQNEADCSGSGGGSAEIAVQGGESPYTYNWSNGDHRATATNLPKGTHTVTVTDGNQCEILYNIEIGIDPASQDLDIPNVFSPNGDGINDTWVVKNLELHPENELVIINRWGNEVYTQKSYKNDWDGTQLNEGTYFYVLKVNMCNEERKFTGYITIIK